MNCKICLSSTKPFGKTTLLNKYEVGYFQCDSCGFIQTEEPYWLSESYDKAINRCDIGLVNRNIILARQTRVILSAFFDANGRFLDYGGGYGLLVRMMRDVGFDFYRYDKYCENIFSSDFEVDERDGPFELVTAYELFEHLANPFAGIDELLTYSKNILFTTELIPNGTPRLSTWWYYIPEYGQHVSFYSWKSLQVIADHYKLHLCSDGKSLHMLSEKKISGYFFKMALHKTIAPIILRANRRPSLLGSDFEKISGTKLI